MATDFHVTIHGKRGDEWEQVCGQRSFPVKSPIPLVANLPGHPRARVYLLDLNEIESSVRQKIVAHLTAKFGLSPDEAELEINEHGIPILEDECSVMVEHPQRWF